MATHAYSTPAATRSTRARLSAAIEAAIAALDALDPDPDLEDGGDAEDDKYAGDAEPDADDEPSLGSPERFPFLMAPIFVDAFGSQVGWADGSMEDGESEAVNEDGCDMGGSDNGLGDQGGLEEQWTWPAPGG